MDLDKKTVCSARLLMEREAFFRYEDYREKESTPEGPAIHVVIEKHDHHVVAFNDRTKSPVIIKFEEPCISYRNLLQANGIMRKFRDDIEEIVKALTS